MRKPQDCWFGLAPISEQHAPNFTFLKAWAPSHRLHQQVFGIWATVIGKRPNTFLWSYSREALTKNSGMMFWGIWIRPWKKLLQPLWTNYLHQPLQRRACRSAGERRCYLPRFWGRHSQILLAWIGSTMIGCSLGKVILFINYLPYLATLFPFSRFLLF